MAHKHSVYDTDTHFIIDGITRAVKNASAVKTMLVQGDHNSERFTFELPRMIDGHDMSGCNDVKVHYLNIDSKTKEKQHGIYVVDDLQIFPDDDEIVVLSWLISKNATKYAGTLHFGLSFRCLADDGTIEYAWNTVVHTGVSVSSGMDSGEEVVEQYADILNEWKEKLEARQIVNLRQTQVGSADGGVNVWTATFGDGTTSRLEVRNGKEGKAGYTPLKGTDYWTPDDIAEINTESKIHIAEELAKRGQLKPEFANDISECTDTTKLYVLPDNFIYAYTKKKVFTEPPELIVHGTNKNYQLNRRLSSSYSESDRNGVLLTNQIDVGSITNPLVVKFQGVKLSANYDVLISVYYYNGNSCLGKYTPLKTQFQTYNDASRTYELDIYNATYAAQTTTVRFWVSVSSDTSTPLTEADVSDLSITIPALAKNEVVTGWLSTGHTFVPADYEERIVSIEKDVVKLKLGISNGDEITVPSYWEDAVNECIFKIKARQSGKNCITFPFFSDNHQNIGYSGLLIAKVMKECHIPYCFYGGDSIASGGVSNEANMIVQDKRFDDMMSYVPNGRFCRAVGNHDGAWDASEGWVYYDRNQVYDLFLREESISQEKEFGEDGTYYYIDEKASKVRFIVLNISGSSLDEVQFEWLKNTAMNFTEPGWAVVFISHKPITNNLHSNIDNAQDVQNWLTSYMERTAANKADVVGWFSGHIHQDRIYQRDHSNDTDADDQDSIILPFKTVTITSDHTGISYDSATKHTVGSDDKSHAIDFVTVDRSSRTVNITRLGIGEDRSYNY